MRSTLAPAVLLALVSVAVAAFRGSAATQAPRVTFNKHIAPLVFDRCGKCHRPGGLAPFSLLTYSSVRQRATQIAAVTRSRIMPPWKVEPGSGEFLGLEPLTDEEIGLIQRWTDEGAVEGDTRDLPRMPQWNDGWQLGRPDLIVTVPQAYTLPAGGPDVFRVFVMPIPVGGARFVRAMELQPGNHRVVHHANILIDRTPTSRERMVTDPTLGETGLLAPTAEYPSGHLTGWTPGQMNPVPPDGLSWRLEPGTDLVVQLHLQPSGKPESVRPSVGFFFSDRPPTRTPALLRLGNQRIDIPAGERDYAISDSYVLPVDVEVLALKPHAHNRARVIEALATLPGGATKRLLRIPEWDFKWQHVYRYATPVALPKGATLKMRYTYDNSAENARNPRTPPERVRWGPDSSDEMGDLWVQVLTRDARDLETLSREFQSKATAEDLIGYETLVARKPDDIEVRDDTASVYLALGRWKEAIDHLETSVRLKPDSAVTHFNLGVALGRAGRFGEAADRYRAALARQPDFARAHFNLAMVLDEQGELDEALAHYRAAVQTEPLNAAAHQSIGVILMKLEKPREALPHFREALRIGPRSAENHYNIGVALRGQGDTPEAIRHFQEALQLRPDWDRATASLAWVLATASDERVRDAQQAVRLAERAVALTKRRDAEALDVLAAARAAAAEFAEAIQIIDEAIRLNPTPRISQDLLARRELYLRRLPYREPSGADSR
jgi:tetratricopeptide (TPR) repeat protein